MAPGEGRGRKRLIDRLAKGLRRVTKLLEVGRVKIGCAEVEVTQIVQSLENEGLGA